jgi:hypothetical protein
MVNSRRNEHGTGPALAVSPGFILKAVGIFK